VKWQWTLWPLRGDLPSKREPRFHYKFKGRKLREGDIVDGVWQGHFIYDAKVIRPTCLEFGYDALRAMDYKVEVGAGTEYLLLKRSDIFNVRRPYKTGDWA
jgi:hypothetical protein